MIHDSIGLCMSMHIIIIIIIYLFISMVLLPIRPHVMSKRHIQD